MPQDSFTTSLKHDSTFSISDTVTSVLNSVACSATGKRIEGGFTATVIVKNDGSTLKKEVVWDSNSDPEFQNNLKINVDALLDEMEKTLKGNGDHNGTITVMTKKN